ncbi:hypothetical protein [Streptomyces sp. ISL-86]|uniref:hypothetical protein n=1 Tax=Streptomyces sp. ISL-86 TaxID=2819187 RepID=UPI001BE7CCB9|nr:hypothetical protein [Streptomyces sp. ISL-86]MBT2453673.1 hypothetical protein [Streptomyces sp. ISL-86]
MKRIARIVTIAASVAALLSPVAVEAYQATAHESARVAVADGTPTDTSWGWGGVQPKLQ